MARYPPGFRFHPTDEELVGYYLKKRVANKGIEGDAIVEVDFYKCEPWDLPEKSPLTEEEWYFFSPRDKKYPNGGRTNRATPRGFYKATGKDKVICGGPHNKVLGMKKTLVFYIGRAPHGERTDWVMHEYRMEEQSACGQDSHVLCRIFNKKGDSKDRSPAVCSVVTAQVSRHPAPALAAVEPLCHAQSLPIMQHRSTHPLPASSSAPCKAESLSGGSEGHAGEEACQGISGEDLEATPTPSVDSLTFVGHEEVSEDLYFNPFVTMEEDVFVEEGGMPRSQSGYSNAAGSTVSEHAMYNHQLTGAVLSELGLSAAQSLEATSGYDWEDPLLPSDLPSDNISFEAPHMAFNAPLLGETSRGGIHPEQRQTAPIPLVLPSGEESSLLEDLQDILMEAQEGGQLAPDEGLWLPEVGNVDEEAAFGGAVAAPDGLQLELENHHPEVGEQEDDGEAGQQDRHGHGHERERANAREVRGMRPAPHGVVRMRGGEVRAAGARGQWEDVHRHGVRNGAEGLRARREGYREVRARGARPGEAGAVNEGMMRAAARRPYGGLPPHGERALYVEGLARRVRMAVHRAVGEGAVPRAAQPNLGGGQANLGGQANRRRPAAAPPRGAPEKEPLGVRGVQQKEAAREVECCSGAVEGNDARAGKRRAVESDAPAETPYLVSRVEYRSGAASQGDGRPSASLTSNRLACRTRRAGGAATGVAWSISYAQATQQSPWRHRSPISPSWVEAAGVLEVVHESHVGQSSEPGFQGYEHSLGNSDMAWGLPDAVTEGLEYKVAVHQQPEVVAGVFVGEDASADSLEAVPAVVAEQAAENAVDWDQLHAPQQARGVAPLQGDAAIVPPGLAARGVDLPPQGLRWEAGRGQENLVGQPAAVDYRDTPALGITRPPDTAVAFAGPPLSTSAVSSSPKMMPKSASTGSSTSSVLLPSGDSSDYSSCARARPVQRRRTTVRRNNDGSCQLPRVLSGLLRYLGEMPVPPASAMELPADHRPSMLLRPSASTPQLTPPLSSPLPRTLSGQQLTLSGVTEASKMASSGKEGPFADTADSGSSTLYCPREASYLQQWWHVRKFVGKNDLCSPNLVGEIISLSRGPHKTRRFFQLFGEFAAVCTLAWGLAGLVGGITCTFF